MSLRLTDQWLYIERTINNATNLPQPGLKPAASLFHARFRNVVKPASNSLQAFILFHADMLQTVLKVAKLTQLWMCSGEAQLTLNFASNWLKPACE